MNKFFFILSTIVYMFVFSACSNSEVNDEINRLTGEKAALEQKVEILQTKLDSLKGKNENLLRELKKLDME